MKIFIFTSTKKKFHRKIHFSNTEINKFCVNFFLLNFHLIEKIVIEDEP